MSWQSVSIVETMNLLGLKILQHPKDMDIWNGNAAVQVQVTFGRNGCPLWICTPQSRPTADMIDCAVTLLSRRGLISPSTMACCHIQDCNLHGSAICWQLLWAAMVSLSMMVQTNVVDNEAGNVLDPCQGMARGHSGVYLERGLCRILNCNISWNLSVGIYSTNQMKLTPTP